MAAPAEAARACTPARDSRSDSGGGSGSSSSGGQPSEGELKRRRQLHRALMRRVGPLPHAPAPQATHRSSASGSRMPPPAPSEAEASEALASAALSRCTSCGPCAGHVAGAATEGGGAVLSHRVAPRCAATTYPAPTSRATHVRATHVRAIRSHSVQLAAPAAGRTAPTPARRRSAPPWPRAAGRPP